MPIIPRPAQVELRAGAFHLTPETTILHDPANCQNALFLQKLLNPPTGLPLEIRGTIQPGTEAIQLKLNPDLVKLGREGYRMEVSQNAIGIEAAETRGIFYGIQSLRQLLPVEIEQRQPVQNFDWWVGCQIITDQPRFSWRGFMLDEGRHFQGKKTMLQTLDLMALQKLNVLHWHLTEDQGWRIEIKKYPKLTEIGSKRAGTRYGFGNGRHNGLPHQGFYSQVEIREIVEYAQDRHITIVPEVEMPGHSLASLAAYPQFSCTGGPFEVATHFGIFQDIYCAGKPAVFAFLEDVLGEVMELFPSEYIHIGGDEAPKKRWKACPDCQRHLKDLGLRDEGGLQLNFINHMAAFLDDHGRQSILWNDMLQEGLHARAVVQFWVRRRKQLIKAIRTERRATIMSTYLDSYLDHSYSLMPLQRAYEFEPIPRELDDGEAGAILGLEFPLWTEWVPGKPRLDYQVYPRLTAMAESGWTPKALKDLNDFKNRLEGFLSRLDRLGVAYAPIAEAEPARIRKAFGIFSIPFPQTKVAG